MLCMYAELNITLLYRKSHRDHFTLDVKDVIVTVFTKDGQNTQAKSGPCFLVYLRSAVTLIDCAVNHR